MNEKEKRTLLLNAFSDAPSAVLLTNMASRQAFLTNESHRIRFFTLKHCSWLNQVEIWFAILSRKIINCGSFISKKSLREKTNRFVDYFNENLATPFKWTYKGKVLSD